MSTENIDGVNELREATSTVASSARDRAREVRDALESLDTEETDATIAHRAVVQSIDDDRAVLSEEGGQLANILGLSAAPDVPDDLDEGDTPGSDDDGGASESVTTMATDNTSDADNSDSDSRFKLFDTLYGAVAAVIVGLVMIVWLAPVVMPWSADDFLWYLNDFVWSLLAAILVGLVAYLAGTFADYLASLWRSRNND